MLIGQSRGVHRIAQRRGGRREHIKKSSQKSPAQKFKNSYDLALALKEDATESNQAEEKAHVMELELEYLKTEAEQLKKIIRAMEERYEKLFEDARNEAEMYRNSADRLRLEAEETLLTWNGKEMGFIICIKRAEEERVVTLSFCSVFLGCFAIFFLCFKA